MIELEPLLQAVTVLTPASIAVVALVGLVVGFAPSSFPLLSVAAGLAAGHDGAPPAERRLEGFRLAAGFALGIASVDAVIGALFGLAGFAVMRVLASYLAIAYAVLGVMLVIAGLALLRIIRVAIPVFTPSARSTRTFGGSYLLGVPFGLSTCPACTPLLLPVVSAAASTGDPVMGAALLFVFGLARGIPIVAAGTAAGMIAQLGRTRRYVRWVECSAGVLMLAVALYFIHEAARFAGWIAA